MSPTVETVGDNNNQLIFINKKKPILCQAEWVFLFNKSLVLIHKKETKKNTIFTD